MNTLNKILEFIKYHQQETGIGLGLLSFSLILLVMLTGGASGIGSLFLIGALISGVASFLLTTNIAR